MTSDALTTWLHTRHHTDWTHTLTTPPTAPFTPTRDGFTHWCHTTVHPRDPQRARRLLAAHHLTTRDARRGAPLTPRLTAHWQQRVLGTPDPPPLRTHPAHAKNGAERYGLRPNTWTTYARALAQSRQPHVPLPARAARAYLDVAFFHPFEDGNARAALLTLVFVLAREGRGLDQVGPLQLPRHADDPAGAQDLIRLVDTLVRCAALRARS
ncbi:Fic family protein [Nocardiopsis sp. NPDC006938]|uniref:Fic family protein n=1 Tax=Nocardiopsis sp. NPDC006938 TaxID=3364337 RepID=UPI0036A633AF